MFVQRKGHVRTQLCWPPASQQERSHQKSNRDSASILDIQPPELLENKSFVQASQSAAFCYGSLSRLIQQAFREKSGKAWGKPGQGHHPIQRSLCPPLPFLESRKCVHCKPLLPSKGQCSSHCLQGASRLWASLGTRAPRHFRSVPLQVKQIQ